VVVFPEGVPMPKDFAAADDEEDYTYRAFARPRRQRSLVTFELWLLACAVLGYLLKRYLDPVKRPSRLISDEEALVGRENAYDTEPALQGPMPIHDHGLGDAQTRFEEILPVH
jgi:hypothetical protein